jgi:hypothetical protein
MAVIVARICKVVVHVALFVGKPIERLLGKPECMWEDNIKMDVRELE